MAFADLYGAWKIEKKTALQKVQSPFFPNAPRDLEIGFQELFRISDFEFRICQAFFLKFARTSSDNISDHPFVSVN